MERWKLKEYLFKLGCKVVLTVNIEWSVDMEMKYPQGRYCWSEGWEQGKKIGSS